MGRQLQHVKPMPKVLLAKRRKAFEDRIDDLVERLKKQKDHPSVVFDFRAFLAEAAPDDFTSSYFVYETEVLRLFQRVNMSLSSTPAYGGQMDGTMLYRAFSEFHDRDAEPKYGHIFPSYCSSFMHTDPNTAVAVCYLRLCRAVGRTL